jgi:uncharacterized protein YjbI with pentapeptide repeats
MMPMLLYRVRRHRITRWIVQHKTTIAIVFGIIFLMVASIWFWGVLVAYIGPKDITDRKDVVQVFALIVAAVVGAIGGIVGIANLQTSRRNLQQQRELEEQRAQEDALQSYFKQMGDLLTDDDLIRTDRVDIRQLARAQTLTVSARLDGSRKGALVRFLYGAGLINSGKAIVQLSGADLSGADLNNASLYLADLGGANLSDADLSDADLNAASLSNADLRQADLRNVNLRGVDVTKEQLAACKSLDGANMPSGRKYEDWLRYNV